MAETDGQEKTEEASGKKLEDQRKEGKVAKSTEIISFSVFSIGMIMLYLMRNFIGSNLSNLAGDIFNSLDTLQLNINVIQLYLAQAALFFFITISPVILAILVFSLAANIGQVGFKITPKALMPKFSKLNVFTGIKNTFLTSKSYVEALKAFLKLLLISGFTYLILEDLVIDSISLVSLSIEEILAFMIDGALSLIWKIALIYAVLAFADFIYQKFKFKKEMKMTKQEVKEESKQTEGDPLIKSKIKSIQYETARRRMMKDIPTADVVVTNPTHFAVAIKYEPEKHHAPKVVAKGMDQLAQRIKQIATENNVPLHEDVQLARALYKLCEVGDFIPEQLFQAVAKILAYIFNLKKTAKKRII